MMLEGIRIVQDHGWVQQPDGKLTWGPTRWYLQVKESSEDWREIDVVKINETPKPDDPILESMEPGTVVMS